MAAKKVFHIISHTHWDREWYLNSKYTNEWLIIFFDNLFNLMAKRPNYIFVLDGQMSMIDDYMVELEKQGKGTSFYKDKIRRYVNEGRLFIGPYYLQPDWQLLSEESLVRNLLIGNQLAKEYGRPMKVGWLLDNFGQISQTAQIHKEANLEGLFVWRGVDIDPENVQSEFIWESPDGSQIHSVYLLDSYRNAMRLAEYHEIMDQRLADLYAKLNPFATTPNLLLMNGYDQEMIPDDILPYIENGNKDTEEYKIIQSSPERYISELIEYSPKLQILQGALYSGRFISVFPGVLSSRMYLKQQNDKSQKLLEKYAEPLSTIVWALGGEYDKSLLDESWKLLLKNHPHDSICGVSIDDVHTDMEERTEVINQLAKAQIKKKAQFLTGLINTSQGEEESFLVFNPSPYKRSEVVEIDYPVYVKNIPAFGYKLIKNEKCQENPITVIDNKIENDYIIVQILKNGTYNIIHKETESEYLGLGVIEDLGDAGDEYNYSYPDNDKIYSTKEREAKINFTLKNKNRVCVRIETSLRIPEGLTKDRKSRSERLRTMPIITYITVDRNSPVVKCKTEIKNTVKNHLVRILFPTDLKTDYAYAGSPFDIVERPTYIKEYDDNSVPDHVKKVIIGAREAKPNTIFLQREFVDVNDEKKGLSIFNKGLPEYTILPERNTIAITLFRSVDWIATDINTRIGDAGPKILVPDAQCLRQMSFEYAVYPHSGNTFTGAVLREADLYNTNLLLIRTSKHDGVLPEQQSFIEITDDDRHLKVTSIKRSEDGESIIIRGFNSSTEKIVARLSSIFEINEAKYVDLLENDKKPINLTDKNSFVFHVGPKKIFTLSLLIGRKDYKTKRHTNVDIIDNQKMEDFSQYESVPLVTKEDIVDEESRAELLKSQLNDPMIRRAALEAQLSVFLTKIKKYKTDIQNLGYLLNDARVKRRVYDYILEYKGSEKDK